MLNFDDYYRNGERSKPSGTRFPWKFVGVMALLAIGLYMYARSQG